MAPGASPIDLRAQILQNCEFFSQPDAYISLVTAKEPLGTFRAILVRAEDGEREVVLSSEAALSFFDALQALHIKSAEAVQNYIATNGYAFAPGVKKRGSKLAGSHDDGDDSDAGSASSSVTAHDCESLSDGETISVTSAGRAKERRKGRKATRSTRTKRPRSRSRSPDASARRARSRSSSSSSSDSEEVPYDYPAGPPRRPPFLDKASAQRMPPRPPRGHFPTWPMPPPPPGLPQSAFRVPGGYGSGPNITPARAPPLHHPFLKRPMPPITTMTTSPTAAPASSPPRPAPPPPPAIAIAATTPTKNNSHAPSSSSGRPQFHDVCLVIRWRHHHQNHDHGGEHRTLDQLGRVTMRALRDAAIASVLRRHHQLLCGGSSGSSLQARVKSVAVGGDGVAYDLSGYRGDDLTRLLAGLGALGGATAAAAGVDQQEEEGGGGGGGGGIPRFEIEVLAVSASASASPSAGLGAFGPPASAVGGGGGGGAVPALVFPSPPGALPLQGQGQQAQHRI